MAYEKFEKKPFKKLLRHIMTMEDGLNATQIDNPSQITRENWCLYTGPQESTNLTLQFVANIHSQYHFYEIYNNETYSDYTFRCHTPELDA